MSLFVRRFIFYSLALIFLITAPIILGYAAGFRYNFKQRRVIKTGALILETTPKGASITLNGASRTEKTPTKIMNLTPSEYSVAISREGYWPWKKQLSVQSEQITFAKNIILLKNNQPTLLVAGAVSDILASPFNETIFYRVNPGPWGELWKIEEKAPELLWRGSNISLALSSATRGALLLEENKGDEKLLFSLEKSGMPIDLSSLGVFSNPVIRLDSREPNIIYVANKGLLQLINVRTRRIQNLEDDIEDMLPLKDRMLLLSKKNELRLLGENGETGKIILALPKGSFHLPAAPHDNWLPIFNKKTSQTILADLSKGSQTSEVLTTIPGKALGFLRGGDEIYLITVGENEIWSFNPRTDTKELVTRLGEEIKQVFLLAGGQLILFTTDQKVRAVELDKRGVRQIWDMAEFKKIEKAALSRDGKFIFIAGTLEGDSGLWKIELK